MLPFRSRLTFEQRRLEYERISVKRPEYVPTIVVRGSRDAPSIDKEKYLLPRELTGAQLSYVIRRRLRMQATDALFLLCEGTTIPANKDMRQLYSEYADEDGFMYITYTLENAFGTVDRLSNELFTLVE